MLGERARKPGIKATAEDQSYTSDEVEFMRAIDSYKRERRRPFPTCSEILGVVKSLGYRKECSHDGRQ